MMEAAYFRSESDFSTRPCIRLAPSQVDEITELATRENLRIPDALNVYLGENLTETQFRVLIPTHEYWSLEDRLDHCYSCGVPLDVGDTRFHLDGEGAICDRCQDEIAAQLEDAAEQVVARHEAKQAAQAKGKS